MYIYFSLTQQESSEALYEVSFFELHGVYAPPWQLEAKGRPLGVPETFEEASAQRLANSPYPTDFPLPGKLTGFAVNPTLHGYPAPSSLLYFASPHFGY